MCTNQQRLYIDIDIYCWYQHTERHLGKVIYTNTHIYIFSSSREWDIQVSHCSSCIWTIFFIVIVGIFSVPVFWLWFKIIIIFVIITMAVNVTVVLNESLLVCRLARTDCKNRQLPKILILVQYSSVFWALQTLLPLPPLPEEEKIATLLLWCYGQNHHRHHHQSMRNIREGDMYRHQQREHFRRGEMCTNQQIIYIYCWYQQRERETFR